MKLWIASGRPFHEVHGMKIWFKRERHEVHLSLLLWKSCFGMDYEMETLIQAFGIQINIVRNQFHGIIHELRGSATKIIGGKVS